MMMKIIRPGLFPALLGLLVLTGSAISQPATITWPEAVAQLAGERAKAETCVALMKRYGDEAQIARAQLTYTTAKADADAVIAGLIAALSAGQTPASLASLQTKLSSGVSGLVEFCGTVSNLLPNTAGQKNVILDIAKVSIDLSSVRSETALRSRLFSSSRSFRRFTCSVFSPPNSWRHR
jgi:hypothetical protein